MDRAVAPHASSLHIHAPCTGTSGTLLEVATKCIALQALSIDFLRSTDSYNLLSSMTQLRSLRMAVGVFADDGSWLSWATPLTSLTKLCISGAIEFLEQESGLSSLGGLTGLMSLGLEDCLAIESEDQVIGGLSALTNLTELTIRPSLLSSAAISQLYQHLPRLAALSCCSADPAAFNVTLMAGQRTRYARISMQMRAGDDYHDDDDDVELFYSTTNANAIPIEGGFTDVCLSLGVYRMPESFLSRSPSLSLLKALKIVDYDLNGDDVRVLGECTRLNRLDVELGDGVQGEDLESLKALTGMKELSLKSSGRRYISEECVSQVFAAMPRLEAVCLGGLQGDARILFTNGLVGQPLKRLELRDCELSDVVDGIGGVLRRMGTSLRDVRLVHCSPEEAGVAKALMEGLPECTQLEKLLVSLWGIIGESTFSQLAEKISQVVTLRELHITTESFWFCIKRNYLFGAVPMVPAWGLTARLPYLRSLTVRVPFGWTEDALIEVSRTCKRIQHMQIVDGDSRISRYCFEALAGLPRLKSLDLVGFSEGEDLQVLQSATSLTEINCWECSGWPLNDKTTIMRLLPGLLRCNLHSEFDNFEL